MRGRAFRRVPRGCGSVAAEGLSVMSVERAAAAGSVVSGILASACCIGPLVFAVLGVSGATLAHRFEPLRPYLLALTYALLGTGFYWTYRSQPVTCDPGGAC